MCQPYLNKSGTGFCFVAITFGIGTPGLVLLAVR